MNAQGQPALRSNIFTTSVSSLSCLNESTSLAFYEYLTGSFSSVQCSNGNGLDAFRLLAAFGLASGTNSHPSANITALLCQPQYALNLASVALDSSGKPQLSFSQSTSTRNIAGLNPWSLVQAFNSSVVMSSSTITGQAGLSSTCDLFCALLGQINPQSSMSSFMGRDKLQNSIENMWTTFQPKRRGSS